MLPTDRRTFLRFLSSAALTAALPKSIERALAIPANHRTGTIEDVEHVVFLMQENRSFDHYFGTLRGVRGFGDPRPVILPSGQPVWYQPRGTGYVLPFHPTAPDLGLQFLLDLPHGWWDTHGAWHGGRYDRWTRYKGRTTMAHLTRDDIPFHYALADAFTICDAYHCSLLGSTDPNRYHMWTGWVGNDGQGGGPVIDNAQDGYGWMTYPERLEAAGISWKVYQDIGDGLDAGGNWGWTRDPYIGNYGDNALLYFHAYQNAPPGSALYEKARTGTHTAAGGTLFDVFLEDVRQGRLPQVSWVIAPEAFSEHGNWPANYGAWYVSQVLDALTSHPEVWSRTVVFVVYDENDGFFDHVVPPTPAGSEAEGASTVDTSLEIYPGSPGSPRGPYGLGIRVPMIVVSPWSKGGWVCSEVFDHTSLIRFLERRFAPAHPLLQETNITAWRRAVCGDLTSAFDFATPDAVPVTLPDTAAYEPPDDDRHPSYIPVPPADQALPAQEPGLRRARPVPYELQAAGSADLENRAFRIDFTNTGQAGACFHVRSVRRSDGPRSYTVEPGKSLSGSWAAAPGPGGRYDLSVHGPNGFMRAFKGSASPRSRAVLDVECRYDVDRYEVVLAVTNRGPVRCTVTVQNLYGGEPVSRALRPGHGFRTRSALGASFGWYDLVIGVSTDAGFLRRLAGHVENGQESASDPAIGNPPRTGR